MFWGRPGSSLGGPGVLGCPWRSLACFCGILGAWWILGGRSLGGTSTVLGISGPSGRAWGRFRLDRLSLLFSKARGGLGSHGASMYVMGPRRVLGDPMRWGPGARPLGDAHTLGPGARVGIQILRRSICKFTISCEGNAFAPYWSFVMNMHRPNSGRVFYASHVPMLYHTTCMPLAHKI